MARYHAIGDLSEDGEGIADAMLDEAMAIVAEATDDHGRLAEAGRAILPESDGPLRILTHCNTGPLACGQFGTALGIVQAAHAAERPLHVWVDETRPYLQGARLTAWELQQAGVPHTLIPDMAAGPLMARGEVDVILVGADRIAANGDTANKIGTYTLAVLAARHGIPFVVCAPLSSVDLATPDGAAIPIEDRSAAEVTEIRGVRIAPEGTDVRNPAVRRDARGADHARSSPRRARCGRRSGPRCATRWTGARHAAAPRPQAPQPRARRRSPADGDRRAGPRRHAGVVAETTTDRELIRAFLDRDRIYAAYALADLEDRDTGRARWGIARPDGEVVALVLEYGGPSPQPLFIAGSDDGHRRDPARRHPAVDRVRRLPPGEPRARWSAATAWSRDRRWSGCGSTERTFRPAVDPGIERLGAMDAGELNRLYRLGFGSWLPPSAIARGRVLRDPGQRPAGRGRRDARHRARGADRGRRQRPDPARVPRTGLRAGDDGRGHGPPARVLRPCRAQCPLGQPAGAERLPAAGLRRARSIRGAARAPGRLAAGPTSRPRSAASLARGSPTADDRDADATRRRTGPRRDRPRPRRGGRSADRVGGARDARPPPDPRAVRGRAAASRACASGRACT